MNVLAADIDGTNANIAIVDTKTMKVLCEDHRQTHAITDFSRYVDAFIKKSGFTITMGCCAIAGPITIVNGRKVAKMTNTRLVISEVALEKETVLEKALLINDFEAIGYATNVLKPKDIAIVRPGKKLRATRVLVGAGTGLGKAFLLYNERAKTYIPVASEGGHADIPVFEEQEFQLIQFVRHKEKLRSVTYEHLVSGPGIERIYEFLAHEKLTAPEVMQRKNSHAREAVRLFTRFYARFCKNAILDGAAVGGLYIAGGIAAKNQEIFSREFLGELNRHHKKSFRELLQNVPVTIITNYDISLVGAAYALEVSI